MGVNGALLARLDNLESIKKAFALSKEEDCQVLLDFIKDNNPIAHLEIKDS